MSVITPPRKSGDGGYRHSVVHMLPWLILTASLLLWGSNMLHTSCSHEVEKLRYDIGQHLLNANHRLIESASTTPSSQSWQLTASCNATMEHVRLLEGLLDPRALLQKLVQQKEGAWLQIGSNTMDNHNSNDPMLKLLQAVPTWQKVRRLPIMACATMEHILSEREGESLVLLQACKAARHRQHCLVLRH